MAKVEYVDVIKTVSGALTKIDKKSQHAADQKMVLATHRVAPTTSPDCSRIYLRGLSSIKRSTPVTSDEMAIRNRFAAVARMVKTRRNDPTRMAGDLVSFNEQKDLPNGKKTMTAYLWMVCGLDYDAQQG